MSTTISGLPPTPAQIQSFKDAFGVVLAIDLANATDPTKGAALVGTSANFAGSTARNTKSKLNDIPSIFDTFSPTQIADAMSGAPTMDHTIPFNVALASGVKNLTVPAGAIIQLNGGSTCVTTGFILTAFGATIRLLPNAANKGLLKLSGGGSSVLGGTWDGNKANGNSPADPYTSYAVLMDAINCGVRVITAINVAGISIKGTGACNYCTADGNTVIGGGFMGVFIDASTTADQIGNRATNNIIDVSVGGNIAQGVLFTSVAPYRQRGWTISGNQVTGPATVTTPSDQAICLGVRGDSGTFLSNITKGGSMGISEGGSDSAYLGNVITNLAAGGVGYGIEPSGKNISVSGNTIRDAVYGIICSGASNTFDATSIVGNRITASVNAVKLQIGVSQKYCSITNNLLVSPTAINTQGDVTGLLVSGNNIIGPGSAVGGSRGIFLDTPSANAGVTISGNRISGVERAHSCYSSATQAFTGLLALGNDLSTDVGSAEGGWTFEGGASAGSRVTSAWGAYGGSGSRSHLIDQKLGTQIVYTENTNAPEGSYNAGIGTILICLNTGQSWFKTTQLGNLNGWRLMFVNIVSDDIGDNNANLGIFGGTSTVRWAASLNANRTVTLPTVANSYNGQKFRVVREATATGAFTLAIASLKSLAAGQWCDVEYSVSGGWRLTAFGSL